MIFRQSPQGPVLRVLDQGRHAGLHVKCIGQDLEPQAVECVNCNLLARRAQESSDPFFHLVAGLVRESQQQYLFGPSKALSQDISHLTHDRARLPGASAGDDQAVVFVTDDCLPLPGGQRVALQRVKELLVPCNLSLDELLVACLANLLCIVRPEQ